MTTRDVFIRAHEAYIAGPSPAGEGLLLRAYLYDLGSAMTPPAVRAMASAPFRDRTLALAVRCGWRLRSDA